MARSDIHRPSLLDPSEYEFVAAFYQGASDAMMKSYMSEMNHDYYPAVEAAEAEGLIFDGNFTRKSSCDHCGAHFNHGVLFRHTPTGELIHVGHICASDTIGLPSKAAASRRRAEKAHEMAKAEEASKARYAEWREANGDVIDYLVGKQEEARPPHPFIADMIHSYNRYGGLSDRQTAAVRKFMESDAKRAASAAERKATEVEPTTPLTVGRRVIKGIIVSTKWQESMYGTTPKMLVREPDGNKVWGTIPEAAFEMTPDTDDGPGTSLTTDTLRGREVEFTATVERSRDDEHFGFYKRPTGIKTREVVA